MPAIAYRPILKAKQGEFGALTTLSDEVKSTLTPVIEPLPDHATEIDRFVKPMTKAWPSGSPFMLDFRLAGDDAAEGLASTTDQLQQHGLSVIPVVASARSDEYIRAAAAVARRHRQGVAIRMNTDDIGDVDLLPDLLDSFLTRLRRDPAEVDLLLDLYAFTPSHIGAMTTATVAAIRALPRVAQWRSVTVIGTSFPETLSGLKADSLTPLPRAEWAVWRRVSLRTLPRVPDFGDYGIAHPELPDVDPRYMTMSANLRYTIEDNWLVFKGRDVKKHGYEQFNAFCKKLVQMPEYAGEDFSWGDGAIKSHCQSKSGPGNATRWRQIGTSHHLTFVVHDLATHDAS